MAYFSYPVMAGAMRGPEHCGMQGQCEFNKAVFAGHFSCSEAMCFCSHFVEATGFMKWVFQDEANWLLMKSVLQGIISALTTVQFQNADYPFGLLHINYQCNSWGVVSESWNIFQM